MGFVILISLFTYSCVNDNASASNQTSIIIPNQVTIMNNILNNQPVIISGGKATCWWIFKHKEDGHMWLPMV